MAFPVSRKGFQQFLQDNLNEPVGTTLLNRECPLAECLKARGCTKAHVGLIRSYWHTVNIEGGDVYNESKTPPWARRFISAVDAVHFRQLTGFEALKFLAES